MILLLVLQLVSPNIKLTPGVANKIEFKNLCPDTLVLTRLTPINVVVRSKVLLRYGLLNNGQSYAIDILIPIELGGEVVLKNLWPIPYETRRETLIKKTLLEHKLHELVCSNQMTLKEAQDEISLSWVDSYNKYFSEAK